MYLEGAADNRKDYDREDGDDDAAEMLLAFISSKTPMLCPKSVILSSRTNHVHALNADTTAFMIVGLWGRKPARTLI